MTHPVPTILNSLTPEQREEYQRVSQLIEDTFPIDESQASPPLPPPPITNEEISTPPDLNLITASQDSSFESRQSAISSFFDNIQPPTDPSAVDFLIVGQDDPTRPAYYSSRDLYTIYADSGETNQGFNVFDFFLPIGGGPPGHWHPWEHEIWYVTDGEIQFTAGNQAGLLESGIPLPPKPDGSFGYTSEELEIAGLTLAPESFSLLAPEGTVVFGSRFRPHYYSNLDSTVSFSGPNPGARLLSLTTGAGLDSFFAYLSQENGQGLVTPEDRAQEIPIPPFPETAPVIEFGIQTTEQPFFQANVAPIFGYDLNYEPPPGTPPHIIVAPPNASPEFLAILETLDQVEGFNTYAFEERPVETGPFGNLRTTLVDFPESGNEFKYAEIFIPPQTANFSQSTIESNLPLAFQAALTGSGVVPPTTSPAYGLATFELNEARDALTYQITITGLDFTGLETPNPLDDVTDIHIHSGMAEENGSHAFNVFGQANGMLIPQLTDDDLQITPNPDGSKTLTGEWSLDEPQMLPIPRADGGLMVMTQPLADFITQLEQAQPGEQIELYVQAHTVGSPNPGEIRGQISKVAEEKITQSQVTDGFPTPIVSNNQESFYVKTGTLSIQINGEVQIVGPDTFAYVAAGQPFSIANLGQETVDVIAMSVVPPNQTIFGSPDDDVIVPGVPSGADLVLAGDGNDVILASELTSVSNNVVQGGRGDDSIEGTIRDTLVGGQGNDIINSAKLNRGSNFLIGQEGDDILFGGNNDFMFGGTGADEFWVTATGAPPARPNIVADFEEGVDKIVVLIPGQVNSVEDLKLIPEGGRNTAIYLRRQNLVEPGTINPANPQPQPLAIVENIEFFNLIDDVEVVFQAQDPIV
ncbi:MAG: CHRD domain-containing protein [Microcoleaceae cyanobacterium MO_207.B10]|nr:CHRD domain-containing protein [Microcoleaceae cyanobacterium MO_207.B10]